MWCGAPAISHDSAEVDSDGRGSHTAQATGSVGQVLVGLDDVDLVDREPEAVAEVGQPGDDAGAGVGGEAQPHRVLAPADGERVDLAARAAGS